MQMQAGEISPETFKQWIHEGKCPKMPWQKELKLDHSSMMFVGGKILHVSIFFAERDRMIGTVL